MTMNGSRLEKNIEATLRLRDEMDQASVLQRVADRVTVFVSSMAFLVLHTVGLAVWIVVNSGVVGVTPFDPWPFPALTLALSIEAIYLTALVLISQRRESDLADARSDLDLQINLLDERETTRLLRLVDAIARKLEVDTGDDELVELELDVDPREVLQRLRAARARPAPPPDTRP